MKNLHKVALFDFCGTVVSLQTADLFTSFVLKKEKKYIPYLLSLLFQNKFYLFIKYKLFKNTKSNKFRMLRYLKGISKKKIYQYSNEFAQYLKGSVIKDVHIHFQRLNNKEDTKIFIISAGYECYIKDFYDERVTVIANKFIFEKNFFTGEIEGADCLGNEKVSRLAKKIDLDLIDRNNSYAYSDSLTDLPLFKLVKNNYFIKGKNIEKFKFDNED